MKSYFFSFLKILIFSFLIGYIFHDLDVDKLAAFNIEYDFLFYSIFVLLLSLSAIALRWKVMLPTLGYKSAVESTFVRTSLNNILPVKIGEIGKIIYLKKKYKVKVSSTLSLLVIDRLMDIICLMITFSVGAFIFNFQDIEMSFIFVFLSLILIIIFLIFLFIKNSLRLINKFRKNKKMTNFIIGSVKIFKSLSMKQISATFFISCIIWFLYILFLYLVLYSAGIDLQLRELLLLFIAITVASAIPLLPSGIGVLEASFIFILMKFGFTKEFSLVLAIYFNVIRAIIPTIIGLYYVFSNEMRVSELFTYKKKQKR